jgi:hypothetical protein
MLDDWLFNHIKAGHSIESIEKVLPFYQESLPGGGSIPLSCTLSTRLPGILERKKWKLLDMLGTKVHLQTHVSVLHGHSLLTPNLLTLQPCSLIVDETPDNRGRPALAFVLVSGEMNILLDVQFPDGSLTGVDMAQAITKFLHHNSLDPESRLRLLCTDSAAYALSGVARFLNSYPGAVGSPCLAHVVNLCGKDIRNHFPTLKWVMKAFKSLFSDSMARRSRLQQFLFFSFPGMS